MRRYFDTIGPRRMAGLSSSVSMPIDMTLIPCASAGITLPAGDIVGAFPALIPIIPGTEGP